MLDEFLLDKLAAQDDENEIMAALSLMPEDDEPVTPDCECNNLDHNILNADCPLYEHIVIEVVDLHDFRSWEDECATHEMWLREAGR